MIKSTKVRVDSGEEIIISVIKSRIVTVFDASKDLLSVVGCSLGGGGWRRGRNDQSVTKRSAIS